eukprot:UN13335
MLTNGRHVQHRNGRNLPVNYKSDHNTSHNAFVGEIVDFEV